MAGLLAGSKIKSISKLVALQRNVQKFAAIARKKPESTLVVPVHDPTQRALSAQSSHSGLVDPRRPSVMPAVGAAAPSFGAMTQVQRSMKRFLNLRGTEGRTQFLKDHPFFQGTSHTLVERLAPQLVRRSSSANSSISGGLVVVQGEEPNEHTDYLFLTSPDFTAKVEILLDGQLVTSLEGGTVFGQEPIFGVTNKFVFGVRVAASSLHSLWVVPKSVLQGMLEKKEHRDDAELLHERAHAIAVEQLRSWYVRPVGQVKVRLFDNAEYAFKRRLVEVIRVRLFAAGSCICRRGDYGSSVFFVYKGEARVAGVARKLAHGQGTSAWAAWWGVLEALGICERHPAEVTAVTDCVVWVIPPEILKELREEHPMEIGILDKVAVEHLKTLQATSVDVYQLPMFKGCDSDFLLELHTACKPQIFAVGDAIVREGEEGEEMFIVARGRAAVVQEEEDGTQTTVAYLKEGSCFGEVAALGIRSTRRATILCETLCDVRVLHRRALASALGKFPRETPRFTALAEAHGYGQHRGSESGKKSLGSLACFEGLSSNFLGLLGEQMTEQVTFFGQVIATQGDEADAMFVLRQGSISIEIDEVHIMYIKAPAIIGEMCLVQPGWRHIATARSSALCALHLVTQDHAERLLEEFEADGAQLAKLAEKNVELLRATLLERFHGFSLKDIAEQQRNEDTETAAVTAKEALERVFTDSDPGFLAFLESHLEKVVYFPDQVMMQQGAEGDHAIVVQHGSCIVEVNDTRVGEAHPGALIGEGCLLSSAVRLRSATVRSVGIVMAYRLCRHVVHEALEAFPKEKAHFEILRKAREGANRALLDDGSDRAEKRWKTLGTVAKLAGASKGGGAGQRMSMAQSSRQVTIRLGGSLAALAMKTAFEDTDMEASPKMRKTRSEPNNRSGVGGKSPGAAMSIGGIRSEAYGGQGDFCLPNVSPSSTLMDLESLREDGESHCSDSESSESSVPVRRSLKPRDCATWARKRKEAKGSARLRRDVRHVRSGKMLPLVPNSQGYKGKESSASRRADSIYGRAVWHEVYG